MNTQRPRPDWTSRPRKAICFKLVCVAVLFLLSSGNSLYAQDFEVCEKLASKGLADTRDASFFAEQAGDDYDFICTAKENRVGRAKQRSTGLSGKYGAISGAFSSGSNDSSSAESIDKMCAEGRRSFINRTNERVISSSGTAVVGLIDSCLKIMSDAGREAILGYTRPSLASDTAFTMLFKYRPSRDVTRKYSIHRVDADPKAGIKCSQGGAEFKPSSMILESETSIVCTKTEGASANGFVVFRAENNYERAVEFRVNSPAGKEILREELREEFDRKIAGLTSELTGQADELKAAKLDMANLGADIECKDVTTTSDPTSAHPIQHKTKVPEADIAAGWRLVAGQCSFVVHPSVGGPQIYLSNSQIIENGTAYFCSSAHTPNVGLNRQLVVSARVCKAKIAFRP